MAAVISSLTILRSASQCSFCSISKTALITYCRRRERVLSLFDIFIIHLIQISPKTLMHLKGIFLNDLLNFGIWWSSISRAIEFLDCDVHSIISYPSFFITANLPHSTFWIYKSFHFYFSTSRTKGKRIHHQTSPEFFLLWKAKG